MDECRADDITTGRSSDFPRWPMLCKDKSKQKIVTVLFTLRASERYWAPTSEIVLLLKSKLVNVLFTLRASKRYWAPTWEMLFQLKFKLVIKQDHDGSNKFLS